MFCGSCMSDNSLAKALTRQGQQVTLLPLYTPLTLDEEQAESTPIFMGGIRVYLSHQYPWFRRLPRWSTHWLDHPNVLNWSTKLGVSNDASQLGGLMISLLKGHQGPQRRLILDVVDYVTKTLKPDVVIFSNILLAGFVEHLRAHFDGQIYGFLQGDDSFLDQLTDSYRGVALEMLEKQWPHFDGFVTFTSYYREYISRYLSIPVERISLIPLGIETSLHTGMPRDVGEAFTLGYFARIAPEKGIHVALETFAQLHAQLPSARLLIGGYLSPGREDYFEEELAKHHMRSSSMRYLGSPQSVSEKVEFFKQIDALCVPATFHEPKGLYVLEALANGVPVVLPARGAFPELVASTRGGMIVERLDPVDLAEALLKLAQDRLLHQRFREEGYRQVREQHSSDVSAQKLMEVIHAGSRFVKS